MPIRNLTTDYSNRSKDINIFSPVDPTSTLARPVAPSFGKVSSYCAGVQKLIQRYAISLLTAVGSQPAYPAFGTGLPARMLSSNLTTLDDISHAFNFANAYVVNLFRRYQETAPATPLDEQLDTAMLISTTVDASRRLNFRVALYTRAGVTYDFLLPIPTTK